MPSDLRVIQIVTASIRTYSNLLRHDQAALGTVIGAYRLLVGELVKVGFFTPTEGESALAEIDFWEALARADAPLY